MAGGFFVGGDVGFVLQRHADVVEAFEQDLLAELVDLEMECAGRCASLIV